MRQEFIEAMTYPRMLMTSHIDASDCPMNRYYNAEHESCQLCEQGEECHWLNRNDEFSVLMEQPMEALVATFEISVDYVDAYLTRENHSSRRCACDSCCWLRDARRLIRQYQNKQARAASRVGPDLK
jgi:hypothetical protein